MWLSFIKSSFRVLLRHRSFSLVNTLGLALGISVFIALSLYVQFELSFDKFHVNADRIYRIEQRMEGGGRIERMTGTPEPLWKAMANDLPEVEASMRVIPGEFNLTPEEGDPFVTQVYFVEHNFLTSFSFNLIHGDPETALSEPFKMVLTESTAMKLFGITEVVGRSYDHGGDLYEITGIIEDVPPNSHLEFDLLASVETISALSGGEENAFGSWGNNWVKLYVMLHQGIDIEGFNAKIKHHLKKYQGEESLNQLHTRPLTEIHLHSDLADEYALRGKYPQHICTDYHGLFCTYNGWNQLYKPLHCLYHRTRQRSLSAQNERCQQKNFTHPIFIRVPVYDADSDLIGFCDF